MHANSNKKKKKKKAHWVICRNENDGIDNLHLSGVHQATKDA